MTVTLTSPALGLNVGDPYTGTLEAWLLANGYATEDGYTGPGVSNTGAASSDVDDDATDADNREPAHWTNSETEAQHNATIANDVDNLTLAKFPNPDFDFDVAGVDDDAPSNVALTPNEGAAAGGTVVTITGQSLENVTAVNFDATPGTALDVTDAAAGTILVTSPAHAAGAVDVTLVDADGNTVVTDGFLYV